MFDLLTLENDFRLCLTMIKFEKIHKKEIQCLDYVVLLHLHNEDSKYIIGLGFKLRCIRYLPPRPLFQNTTKTQEEDNKGEEYNV